MIKALFTTLATVFMLVHSAIPVLAQTGASLSFEPAIITIGVEQTFVTDLVLNPSGASVGGVGAILLYDPQYVAIERIETGSTFSEYPLAAYDNAEGRVAISGIVNPGDNAITDTSAFAKIYWKALTLGPTTIRYDFEPELTTESNVTLTTGPEDALSLAIELPVTIVPETQPGGILPDMPIESQTASSSRTSLPLLPVISGVILLVIVILIVLRSRRGRVPTSSNPAPAVMTEMPITPTTVTTSQVPPPAITPSTPAPSDQQALPPKPPELPPLPPTPEGPVLTRM